MSRSSPPEVFSNKVTIHYTKTKQTLRRTKGQTRVLNKVTLQLYGNHPHARMHPREFTSYPQNTSP